MATAFKQLVAASAPVLALAGALPADNPAAGVPQFPDTTARAPGLQVIVPGNVSLLPKPDSLEPVWWAAAPGVAMHRLLPEDQVLYAPLTTFDDQVTVYVPGVRVMQFGGLTLYQKPQGSFFDAPVSGAGVLSYPQRKPGWEILGGIRQ